MTQVDKDKAWTPPSLTSHTSVQPLTISGSSAFLHDVHRDKRIMAMDEVRM